MNALSTVEQDAGELVDTAVVNPWQMLNIMVRSGRDVSQLKDMMDLVRQWESDQAAKAYASAVRSFQSKCPPIVKRNEVRNNAGELMYCFADYDDVMDRVQPILTECGIAVTFDTKMDGMVMITTCHVRVGTHVEDTSVPLAIPEIPKANSTQKAGGALKYGMRYALVAALNIRVKGEDNDAQGQFATISKDEWSILEAKINDCHMLGNPVDRPKFLEWLEVDHLMKLPKESFSKAVDFLDRKARQVKK